MPFGVRVKLRKIARLTVFGASLVVFAGWLAEPELVRIVRDFASSHLPVFPKLVEANDFTFAVADVTETAGAPAESGIRVILLLAVLIVLFGFRAPQTFLDHGYRSARRFVGSLHQGLRRSLRGARAGSPATAGFGRPVAFLLSLGLFLGWLSAPGFLRERDASIAQSTRATDPAEISPRLLDRFASWVGPVSLGRSSRPPADDPAPQDDGTEATGLAEDEDTLITLGSRLRKKPSIASPVNDEQATPTREDRRAAWSSPAGIPFVPDDYSFDGGGHLSPHAANAAADSSALRTAEARSATGSPKAGASDEADTPNPGDPGKEEPPAEAGVELPPIPLPDDGRGEAEPDLPAEVFAEGEVLVQLASGTAEDASLGALLEDYEAEESEFLPSIGYHVLRVDPETDVLDLVGALLDDPRVANAQPNHLYGPAGISNDSLSNRQWAHRNLGVLNGGGLRDADIDTEEAWARMSGGHAARVAVLDTGFPRHPDLPPATNIRVAGADDDRDHATKVAGIIAAIGDNGVGIAGVNKHWVDLVFIDVFTDGEARDSDIIAGIEAIPPGTHVANLSLGALRIEDTSRPHPLCDAMKQRRDVLFVVASGNTDAALPNYPAACGWLNDVPNVLSIASTDEYDLLATTSNFGPWVDLAAPGEGILTTLANGAYGAASGTSMAAPHVSGVASLLFASGPTDAATVKTRILESVDVLPQLIPFVATGGRLNACRALRSAGIGPNSGCGYEPGS